MSATEEVENYDEVDPDSVDEDDDEEEEPEEEDCDACDGSGEVTLECEEDHGDNDCWCELTDQCDECSGSGKVEVIP
jgi:DnaJ-class molecular chaperone